MKLDVQRRGSCCLLVQARERQAPVVGSQTAAALETNCTLEIIHSCLLADIQTLNFELEDPFRYKRDLIVAQIQLSQCRELPDALRHRGEMVAAQMQLCQRRELPDALRHMPPRP